MHAFPARRLRIEPEQAAVKLFRRQRPVAALHGTCIHQQKGSICDEPAVRAVLTKLQIPENHIVWGMAALGYAEEKPAAADKKPAAETVGWIL